MKEYIADSNYASWQREGNHGVVVRVSAGLVAKFVWSCGDDSIVDDSDMGVYCLEKEYKIARELFEGGVSVPKPEGLFGVRADGLNLISMQSRKLIPAFVMGYVEAAEKMSFDEQAIRRDLADREGAKAIALGWNPPFDVYWNALYVPQERRVYLSDFVLWTKKAENQENLEFTPP